MALPEPITRLEQYWKAILDKIEGGGGSSVTVEPLTVTQNGTTTAPSGKAYNPVTANVPNSYGASDEGKVVNNGALVSQTAHAPVTQNGTIDTTANNSVTVAVPIQQSKSVTIDEAGTVTITPDSGYEAMGEVVVTAEVPSVSTMTLFAHVENGQTPPHFATVGATCASALFGKTAVIAVADGDTTSGTYVVFSVSAGAASVVFWRGTDESKITAAFSSSGWTITGATSLDMYRASIVLPDRE